MLMVVLALASGLGSAYAQPRMKIEPAVENEMKKALAPLGTLSEQQKTAVAALALAYRAGMPVESYCPPLGRFSGEHFRCEAQAVAFVRERDKCKSADPDKKCPGVAEAEAAWSACEHDKLGEELTVLGVVRHWPPIPQPDPIPPVR